MKKVELEKQASSEIAQSRERFENQIDELCGQLNELRPGTGPGIRVLLKMAYEQAERDTRELCAQLLDVEAEKAAVWEEKTDSNSAWHVKANLQRVAERIRRKE